jgi:hypothetical protein
LSVAGTAFGMVATAVGSGPAWRVHVVFVSLALVVLGLLIWTGRSDVQEQGPHAARDRQTEPSVLIGLMALTSVTLLAASIIHFGPALPFGGFGISDQFAAAAGPEAILGIVLALGTAYLASGRTGSREMALASTVFTLLLSLYGLSVTLPMALTGDVVYHIVLVVLLGSIIVGLVLPMMRSNSGRTRSLSVGSQGDLHDTHNRRSF